MFLICIVIQYTSEEVVKRMNSQKRINALCYIGLTLGSLIVLVPILYMASTSFKSINEIMTSSTVTMFPKKFSTEAYKNVITEYPFFTYLKNSVVISLWQPCLRFCSPHWPVMVFRFSSGKRYDHDVHSRDADVSGGYAVRALL